MVIIAVQTLREADEADVELAMLDSYVARDFADVDRAKLIEFGNRLLD